MSLINTAARRYGRGHSGFASSAARPRRAAHGSRSATGRQRGGACCACNRATGALAPDAALVTVAALLCARLGIPRRRPDSGETAALQNAEFANPNALPFGMRAGDAKERQFEKKFSWQLVSLALQGPRMLAT